ncbi:MAG: SAM-dependent methyltransferase [Desulfomicrobium sp.]|nr:SAM-dependent methyltransferase [Pseudomonadota bacterium]MBU4570566.1 SAM-dependent methyltransferase [Pseudomonadota bacterium]MBV1710912.1 SAM-dependent methyltransferase [Desulfomicrobium sp.]MBV1719356.1 SAM-dependent methyltransferase [Desulfomicrobium sp.]MBV1749454.1 SAM-dependent methyltransferase [Desulfomicrobium sp.]
MVISKTMMQFDTKSSLDIEKSVAQFSLYSDQVQDLLLRICNGESNIFPEGLISSTINGNAAAALRRLVPIQIRKKLGLFFTDTYLSDNVAKILAPYLRKNSKILDPACGSGNLLLSCAKHLEIGKNLNHTLSIWSDKIIGYDLYDEFIRAAKLRLIALAISYHLDEIEEINYLNIDCLFNKLKTCNFFSQLNFNEIDCIVVNPPFGQEFAPDGCVWGSGMVQMAALFFEKLIRIAHKDMRIVAILPDVLRSGTRYKKWRSMISSSCSSIEISAGGRFDKTTDVDVFVLHAVLGRPIEIFSEWNFSQSRDNSSQQVVNDYFNVRVGTVVPHRDPLVGPVYPYIYARSAPSGKILCHIGEFRPFSGTVFRPPFVVLHRTSSPHDRSRCIATIVNLDQEVAVENHLIVFTPHDSSIDSCKKLLDILQSKQSSEWLNSRIRCRHLTVSSLRELPWFDV